MEIKINERLKEKLLKIKKENNEDIKIKKINEILFRILEDQASNAFGNTTETLIIDAFGLGQRTFKTHDATFEGSRIEIKCTTALSPNEKIEGSDKLLQRAIDKYTKIERVQSKESGMKYQVNIKQSKPDMFEDMIFGICYRDQFDIYLLPSSIFTKDILRGYSDKLHAGNQGEGQIGFTDATIDLIKDYHVCSFSYFELFTAAIGKEATMNLAKKYIESLKEAHRREEEFLNASSKILMA